MSAHEQIMLYDRVVVRQPNANRDGRPIHDSGTFHAQSQHISLTATTAQCTLLQRVVGDPSDAALAKLYAALYLV